VAVSGIGAAGAVGAYSLTPTLTTNVAPTIDDARNLALSSAAVSSSTPQSGITVTLGNPVAEDVVYGKPAALDLESLVWATPPADNISHLMEISLKAHLKSASLVGELGAQLLDRFAKTQSDFRQAVVDYRNPSANGAEDINAAASATVLQNAQYIQNNISLKIYTVSGKRGRYFHYLRRRR
jgi:hypothetical protein